MSQHLELVAEFMEKENLSLLGDGRSDSPGRSAKYTTYTLMEEETKKIIAVELGTAQAFN